MAIGERIKYFRNLKGMTQKQLGIAIGFPEKTADIRMAQYETGIRTPKADLTNAIANVLDVSPQALANDIDSDLGLLHTMFTLEDTRGFRVEKADDEIHLVVDENSKGIFEMLSAWAEQSEKYTHGDITKEEYDRWRYNFPKYDTTQHWVKIPSQELSDAMVKAFKDKLKDH